MNQPDELHSTGAFGPLMVLLKRVVLDAVERPEPDGGLLDHEPLFGPEARLDLDSLDALQISMAIQARFGVRMPDSKETRKALHSIAHLAQHLHAHGIPAVTYDA